LYSPFKFEEGEAHVAGVIKQAIPFFLASDNTSGQNFDHKFMDMAFLDPSSFVS
jgi:hypothetical protein